MVKLIVSILVFSSICVFITALFEYRNVKCITVDKSFTGFDQCVLKAHNRTFKYLSIKVALYQTPVTNATVNLALMKNSNGYKPFYFNMTFDCCKFFQLQNKRNIFLTYMQNLFKEYSNMNHSCPYDHDLIVKELPANFLNKEIMKTLPVPSGEYALYLKYYAYNVLRAEVRVYYQLTN